MIRTRVRTGAQCRVATDAREAACVRGATGAQLWQDDTRRVLSGKRSGNPLFDAGDVADGVGTDRLDIEKRDAGGFERGDAVFDVALGADQR